MLLKPFFCYGKRFNLYIESINLARRTCSFCKKEGIITISGGGINNRVTLSDG
jgi:hypothetical protein